MNNFLKYGDLVMLYRPGESSGKTEGEEGSASVGQYGGLISCLGHTDTGVYMQELPKPINDENVRPDADLNVLGMRDAVFTITPRLNYDFHKEYKKSLRYFQSIVATLKNVNNTDMGELLKLRENLKAKLIKLEKRTQKEEELNLSLILEHTGKPIMFGSEVQLMHFDSNCFIKATDNCSQTESIGYVCELSNFYSSGMIFKISPKYRSRHEGDAIQLRDSIVLQNLKHKAYLTVSKEIPIQVDLANPPETNPFLVNSSTFDSRGSRNRMFLSQENETPFQVILYRPHYTDAHMYLLGGDIVKVTHTEMQADLTATISYSAEANPEVYFRSYDGEYKEETSALHSYWFLEHLTFDEAGDKFSVEANKGTSKKRAKVRLRNLITGGNIFRQPAEEVDGFKLFTVGSSAKSDRFCTFEMEPVVKNCEHLLNNQIYFLTEHESGCYLKYDRNAKIQRNNEFLMNELRQKDPQYLFYPLEVSDLNQTNHLAKLSMELSSEDAYVVHKVPEAEKKEILFMRSVIPTFKYMRKVFAAKKQEDIDPDIYQMIIKTLQLIIAFLFDLDPTAEIDYLEIEDMPAPRKQKLLKDIGFIDCLIQLVYLPFSSGLYTFKTFTLADSFGKMLEMAYTSVRYAIKEYRPSELYASQWIHLLIEQSLQTSGDNDIRAGQTLTELIDNNQRILESRIELSTIGRFVRILREKDKDSKYVDILRAICTCDGIPMIKNQKDMTKEVLEVNSNKDQLIFGITNDTVIGVVLSLKIKNLETVPLASLEQESGNVDDGKTFAYILSMVRLFSDLCKDRNYLCIDTMQKEFTYDICFEIISNQKYGYSVREAFTLFMINLWIDISPLQRIILPCQVKFWEGTSDNSSSLKEQPFVIRHDKLKQFLFSYLEELKDDKGNEKEDRTLFNLAILQLTE